MRPALIPSITVLATSVVTVACGSFLAADDSRPGTDPVSDAAVEAGGPADGSGPTDDASADAGRNDGGACTPIFSDDFDLGDAGKWEEGNGCAAGGLAFEARNNGYAATIACSNGSPGVFRTLSTPKFALRRDLRVEFSFRIEAGSPTHVFAQLLSFTAEDKNVAFVYGSAGVAITPSDSQTPFVTWPAAAGVWHTMTVAFREGMNKETLDARAELDGISVPYSMKLALGHEGPFRFQLGPYLNLEGGTAKNAYDDVQLRACP